MAQTLRQPGDRRPGARRAGSPGSGVPGGGQAEPAEPGAGPAAARDAGEPGPGPAVARGTGGAGGTAGAGGAAPGWRPPVGPARISAVSGIVFAVLFAAAIVLIAQGPRLHDPDSVYQAFYAGGGHLIAVAGMNVVPFAGIAFLYHLAANRALYRGLPGVSPLQAWLQVTSAVVFLCMMFAGTAALGAPALLGAFGDGPAPGPETARTLAAIGYGLMFVFGVRVAGMHMLTTIGLARKAGLLPRWLALIGMLTAAFLLLSATYHPGVLLVFPAWTAVLGVVVLLRVGRGPAPEPERK